MVTNSTSLTHNGIKDWLIQRVSAVILAAYIVLLLCLMVAHPNIDYATWSALFQPLWMKCFTLLAMLSLIAHAWVGVWTVLTDYLHCAYARAVLMIVFILAFLFYLAWIIEILWG